MRLTLRTLLAYLDDLLKPVDARELGKRLSESSAASAMAGRIKEVLRRRRIGAPDIKGDPDPNTVAEYLDNILTDEEIEAHERACLSSDEVLAETAACHQILSLVMGKPIEVSDSLKQQAYDLEGPGGPEASAKAVVPPPRAGHGDMVVDGPSANGSAPAIQESKPVGKTAPASVQPDPLPSFLAKRNSATWPRVIGGVLATGVAIALFALLYQGDDSYRRGLGDVVVSVDDELLGDRPMTLGDQEPGDDESSQTEPAEPAAASRSGKAQIPSSTVADAGEGPSTPTQPRETPNTEPAEPSAAKPAAVAPAMPAEEASDADDGPMIASATPPARTMEPGADDTSAKPASEPPTPLPETTDAPVEVATPLLEPFQWQQTGDGLALHENDLIDGWSTLVPRALVFPGERIVVPDPFDCSLRVDQGPVVFRLLADTDGTVLPPSSETRGGFELTHGRVIVKSMADKEGNQASVPLRFSTHGHSVTLALGPGAVVAFESTLEPADKVTEAFAAKRVAQLSVIEGPVFEPAQEEAVSATTDAANPAVAATAGAEEAEPVADDTVSKDDASSEDEGPAVAAPEPQPDAIVASDAASGPRAFIWSPQPKQTPLSATPEWVIETEPSKLTRRYATMFRNLLPDERPLVPELRAILGERTYRMSELAASTLSLLGEVPSLVTALDSVHQETRVQAIKGIRTWLAQDPARIERLPELLAAAFRQEAVEALQRLLVGYDVDDLRDPTNSARLVADLEDADVAVREAAIYVLEKMTDRTFDYRPNANAQTRGVAVRRWRDYVAREGALLTPVIDNAAGGSDNSASNETELE